MTFTDYEKHHLHKYVDKMGSTYNKLEMDNRIAALKTEITTLIQSSIQTALRKFSVDLRKSIIQFRNEQIKNRIGRKYINLSKTNYTWIKLLDKDDFQNIDDLTDAIILNVFIKRFQRYHHSKSSHVANAFTNLEFFYDSGMMPILPILCLF